MLKDCIKSNRSVVHIADELYDPSTLALAAKLGRLPDKGYVVCKLCGMKGCINPKHLAQVPAEQYSVLFGTMLPKAKESVAGEHNPRAKLTERDVREIRQLLKDGHMSQRGIAMHMSTRTGQRVTQGMITDINRGLTWANVTLDDEFESFRRPQERVKRGEVVTRI